MERIELQVTGMTCGACVARVNRALLGVPGTQNAEVDLAHGLARVSVVDARVASPALLQALADAGYPAQLATVAMADITDHAPVGAGCGSGTRAGGGCCCRH